MSRPPPTFIGRQGVTRINLALKRGKKGRARSGRHSPGVVRRVEQVRADAAAKGQFGGDASAGGTARHHALASSRIRFHHSSTGSGATAGSGPTQKVGVPSTVTTTGCW